MAAEPCPGSIIVKVGGSLFDLPDLGVRLTRWLESHPRAILIPGGGPTALVVRELDRCHHLGEEHAHWLALYAMALNARFLAALLPRASVAESLEACASLMQMNRVPVLDAHAFGRADEGQPDSLPHCWEVTSDSLAARVAHVAGARRLILLKSVSLPRDLDLAAAAEQGYVDGHLASLAAGGIRVEAINFREWDS